MEHPATPGFEESKPRGNPRGSHATKSGKHPRWIAADRKRRRLAMMAAAGASMETMAREFGVLQDSIRQYLLHPDVKKYIAEIQDRADKRVEDLLFEGERTAIEWATEALRDIDVPPAVKKDIALSLLDRAGRRGPVVQKQESKNLNYNAGPQDLERALQSALADPGVRLSLGMSAMHVLPGKVMEPDAAEEIVMGSPEIVSDAVPSEEAE